MIEFACAACGQKYAVPDAAAGRSARCKCGGALTVPAVIATAPDVNPLANKLPMRIRRLQADAREMAAAFVDFPPIRVRSTLGEPPETYQVEYHVHGLDRGGRKGPVLRELHVAELQLTADYPRLAPKCRMLTPVFHPNIDPATICVGDHWTAGERLVDLVVRIGEMLAYQAYNIKSPLDAEAAMWADLNANQLPIDPRNLRPPELER
jgi:ubiquitin-protein ligase